MAPGSSKGKNSKQNVQRLDWKEASLNGSVLILSVVKEAATFAPFAELKHAASVALFILQTIQAVKQNKEAYERLGDDSVGLIAAIWRSYRKAEAPDDWLSAEMREILEDLTHTLEQIATFVGDQLSRNKAIRVIFSRVDTVKINEYRDHLNYAMQKFELQSHMNINDVLMQLVRKNDQISEQILYRNEAEGFKHARETRETEEPEKIHEEESKAVKEISAAERLKQVEADCVAMDERRHADALKKIEKEAKDRLSELERLRTAASVLETENRLKKAQDEEIAELRRKTVKKNSVLERLQQVEADRVAMDASWHVDELKKIEKEAKERRSELERLRTAASALELANRLRKAEEEEMAELRRKIAADNDSRQSATQVQSSKKKSSRRQDEVGEEEWRGGFTVEGATSEEEEVERRPVRRGFKVKKAPSKSPRRRPAVSEDSAGDDEEDFPLRNPKIRLAGRRPSSTSLRVEAEDDSMYEDEDDLPPRPRKSARANREPQGSSGSTPDLSGLLTQFRGTPMGLGSSHGSGSNSYFPTYGSHSSPAMVPYGYAPGTVVNSGVGNITNTTFSNVGNNNSVKHVYHTPRTRSQRRSAGN